MRWAWAWVLRTHRHAPKLRSRVEVRDSELTVPSRQDARNTWVLRFTAGKAYMGEKWWDAQRAPSASARA